MEFCVDLSIVLVPDTHHISFVHVCFSGEFSVFLFYGLANIYTLDCVALSKPNLTVCLVLCFVNNKK